MFFSFFHNGCPVFFSIDFSFFFTRPNCSCLLSRIPAGRWLRMSIAKTEIAEQIRAIKKEWKEAVSSFDAGAAVKPEPSPTVFAGSVVPTRPGAP